jgi:hypothetical protein
MTTATKRRKKKIASRAVRPAAQTASVAPVNVAQDVDRAKIAAMTFQHAGNPLTFVAGAGDDVRKAYAKLKTEEARKAFWDSFEFSMERTAPSGWASIYEALELLRQEPWYWGEKHKTFEDYLRNEQAFAFRQLDALEDHHQFALMAYPQLFSADRRKAAKAILSRRKVEAEQAAAAALQGVQSKGGQAGNTNAKRNECVAQNGQHIRFSPATEVDLAAQSDEFQTGYRSHGSTNRFYRFRVLKSKAPKIAQRVLDGQYTRQRTDGTYFVDLGKAEEDAEKAYPQRFKKHRQKSRAKPPLQKAKEAISKLSPEELKQIAKWIRNRK